MYYLSEISAGLSVLQGVNTDAVLGVVLDELEQQDKLKLAFHMEPYEGNAGQIEQALLFQEVQWWS
jgi:hypothetical protein